MNSNEALPGTVPANAAAGDNVREIFPGASSSRPVANRPRHMRRLGGRRPGGTLDAGMATAEYAIATLAAVGFAGLLVVILKSDEVRGFLMNIIRTALSM